MIHQYVILFGHLTLGELIVYLMGIKLSPSIIDVPLLTLFLKLSRIKLHWVQGLSSFLVTNSGFFPIPSGMALMLCFDVIAAEFWPMVTVTIISTAFILIVTRWVHQIIRKFRLVHQIKLTRKLHLTDLHLSEKLHLRDKISLTNKDK